MDYQRCPLHQEFVIDKLITFHYKELTSKFNTKGERHDFWEFAYVDAGEVEIYTDTNRYALRQGDIVFYSPNEFHAGKAINDTAPKLVIVSFDCTAECIEFFRGKALRLDDEERTILSRIIKEGTHAFNPPVDSPFMRFPNKKPGAPFGSEQIIRNYLEILLISLIRKGEMAGPKRLSTISAENKEVKLVEEIIRYMKDNLRQDIVPDQLCMEFALSRTRLMTMFKSRTGLGIREYFNKLRVDSAKQAIRENNLNFSEISEHLGYSSVHYFSKQFKKLTGMTPTEYGRSVKAR